MRAFLKQISIFTFLLYYLFVSTGVNIKLHYCEGEVSDIAVISNHTSCDIHQENTCISDCNISHLDHNNNNNNSIYNTPHQCCSNEEIYVALIPYFNLSLESKVDDTKALATDLIFEDNIENCNNQFSHEAYNQKYGLESSYPPPYIAYQQLVIYS